MGSARARKGIKKRVEKATLQCFLSEKRSFDGVNPSVFCTEELCLMWRLWCHSREKYPGFKTLLERVWDKIGCFEMKFFAQAEQGSGGAWGQGGDSKGKHEKEEENPEILLVVESLEKTSKAIKSNQIPACPGKHKDVCEGAGGTDPQLLPGQEWLWEHPGRHSRISMWDWCPGGMAGWFSWKFGWLEREINPGVGAAGGVWAWKAPGVLLFLCATKNHGVKT